jgi:GNAT superfamily N-acetyltransferase
MSQSKAFHEGREHFTYQFHPADVYAGTHEVTAHDTRGKQVGSLKWNGAEVENIETVAKHRRKGIGTAMYATADRAASSGKAPQPVSGSLRSHAGDALSKKLKRPGHDRPEKHIEWTD